VGGLPRLSGPACDATKEVADWFDADPMAILCPTRHGWWWRTGRELLTAGADLYLPYQVVAEVTG
jgi:hypothetical protein